MYARSPLKVTFQLEVADDDVSEIIQSWNDVASLIADIEAAMASELGFVQLQLTQKFAGTKLIITSSTVLCRAIWE